MNTSSTYLRFLNQESDKFMEVFIPICELFDSGIPIHHDSGNELVNDDALYLYKGQGNYEKISWLNPKP